MPQEVQQGPQAQPSPTGGDGVGHDGGGGHLGCGAFADGQAKPQPQQRVATVGVDADSVAEQVAQPAQVLGGVRGTRPGVLGAGVRHAFDDEPGPDAGHVHRHPVAGAATHWPLPHRVRLAEAVLALGGPRVDEQPAEAIAAGPCLPVLSLGEPVSRVGFHRHLPNLVRP